MRLSRLLTILLVSASCGGITAEAPINVKLGIDRDQTTKQLSAHKYCHKEDGGPQPNPAIYPRCSRPGAEWGDSWIAAKFDGNQLVELKRYEQFSDEARATERWNQLIADRAKLHPDAPDAGPELEAKALEPGTKSLKAWRLDDSTVVGVYLLTPTPPANASILEAVIKLPKSASSNGIEVVH